MGNVIIAESEEYLMQEILQRLPSKQRPRENRKEREALAFDLDFIVKRTFLCEAPKYLDSKTVAQSTTEAVRSSSSATSTYFTHARGLNPRRIPKSRAFYDLSVGQGAW